MKKVLLIFILLFTTQHAKSEIIYLQCYYNISREEVYYNFVLDTSKKKVEILNKLNKKNDILIFIDAKKKEINKRLRKRHNISLKILKKFQLPVELKKKKADFIIKNNFKSNSIKKNVKIILGKILLNA